MLGLVRRNHLDPFVQIVTRYASVFRCLGDRKAAFTDLSYGFLL